MVASVSDGHIGVDTDRAWPLVRVRTDSRRELARLSPASNSSQVLISPSAAADSHGPNVVSADCAAGASLGRSVDCLAATGRGRFLSRCKPGSPKSRASVRRPSARLRRSSPSATARSRRPPNFDGPAGGQDAAAETQSDQAIFRHGCAYKRRLGASGTTTDVKLSVPLKKLHRTTWVSIVPVGEKSK